MSLEGFIRAMPKVALDLQLECAVQRETMLMLADQNEMRDTVKRFDKWVQLYKTPDFKRIDELTAMLRSWIKHADDLVRAVYDVGVSLSKENIRYAEIGINPLAFVSGEFTFDEFMSAINDGRDRAERAWGVQMRWVMLIPREDPRKAEEVARWATSATARKGGVVAVTLTGNDKRIGIEQFERAFRNATKKELAKIAYLTEKDDVLEAIEKLDLNVIADTWGIWESEEVVAALKAQGVRLSVCLSRAVANGLIPDVKAFPLRAILDTGLTVLVDTAMPVLLEKTLSDEYFMAVNHGLISLEELQTMGLQSIEHCHLPEDEKALLRTTFELEYEVLREQHPLG